MPGCVEHVLHFGKGIVRGNTQGRNLVRNCKRALGGMSIGMVLHPAMLFAFANGSGILQH
jgi:hypothetical protein